MVPPNPPSSDGQTRNGRPLPTTGVESASVFDLPYATDGSALPPPPDRVAPETAPETAQPAVTPAASTPPPFVPRAQTTVLPPSYSAPHQPATDSFALPPSPATSRRTPPPAMPAPLAAGPLVGPALTHGEGEGGDYDRFDRFDRFDGNDDAGLPLPPMVAKGSWDEEHPGQTAPPGSGASLPPAPATTAPPQPAPASAPSYGSAPAYGSPPPFGAAPPPPPPALTFSPDASLPDPPPSTPASGPPPPVYAPLAPLTPSAHPRLAGRTPAPIVSTTRLGDGLLVAAAAASVAGLIWWGVVAVTQRQFVYVAILLGVMVGQAALIGGRRGSITLGAMAGVFTLLSLTLTQYFITRSLAISELGLDLPLWDGTSNAVEIIRGTFEEDPLTGLFVVLAAGIAGVQAGMPGKRASGAWGEPRPSRSPAQIL